MRSRTITAILLILILTAASACVSKPPVTIAPMPETTTEAPETESVTEAPTTEAPTTEVPTTEAPTTEEPTTEEPTTEPEETAWQPPEYLVPGGQYASSPLLRFKVPEGSWQTDYNAVIMYPSDEYLAFIQNSALPDDVKQTEIGNKTRYGFSYLYWIDNIRGVEMYPPELGSAREYMAHTAMVYNVTGMFREGDLREDNTFRRETRSSRDGRTISIIYQHAVSAGVGDHLNAIAFVDGPHGEIICFTAELVDAGTRAAFDAILSSLEILR